MLEMGRGYQILRYDNGEGGFGVHFVVSRTRKPRGIFAVFLMLKLQDRNVKKQQTGSSAVLTTKKCSGKIAVSRQKNNIFQIISISISLLKLQFYLFVVHNYNRFSAF